MIYALWLIFSIIVSYYLGYWFGANRAVKDYETIKDEQELKEKKVFLENVENMERLKNSYKFFS